MNPLHDIPADAPEWVRFAARMAALDACDWSDRGQVEACVGPLTDAQWARFGAAVATNIQFASQVVITEGWVKAVEPVWEPDPNDRATVLLLGEK